MEPHAAIVYPHPTVMNENLLPFHVDLQS